MLFIFGEITTQTAEQVIRGLQFGEREIVLMSVGGDVYAALAIYDALRQYEDTTIIATGFVASSAVLVLLGANERIATPNCRFMTHPVKVESEANDTSSDERRAIQDTIQSIFMERTGMSGTDASVMLGEELVFGVETAQAFGIMSAPRGCSLSAHAGY